MATRLNSLMTSTCRPNSPINCCLFAENGHFHNLATVQGSMPAMYMRTAHTRPSLQGPTAPWGPRTRCWPLPSVSSELTPQMSQAHIALLSDPRGLGGVTCLEVPACTCREGWTVGFSEARSRQGWLPQFSGRCYLHVRYQSLLKLSLRNPDPHDLSHTSSANKAVSVASQTSEWQP